MTVDAAVDLADIASVAARAAGLHIAAAFRGRVATRAKTSFHDLVTEVDHEAEDIVVEEILRRCPDSRILAEEGGARGSGRVQWYVDPIDGTNNFARGIPFFCVSIAAAVDGRLEAAAIYDPVRAESMTATRRGGAFLDGVPMTARGAPTDEASLLLTDFPSPKRPADLADVSTLATLITRFGTVRRLGSGALALAYVACGRADAALMTTASVWDIAAGALLVEIAGGQHAVPAAQSAAPWMGPVYVAACRDLDLASSALRIFVAA
jgi:myo-inositol-1(or 4)-monophosphatase